MLTTTTRHCRTCDSMKPLDQFYRGSRQCKACTSSERRDWRIAAAAWFRKIGHDHKRDMAAYRRLYIERPGVRETVARQSREWRAAHPERVRAFRTMYRALAQGKIERATDCANCGRDGRLFPHFHDYAEPLIVHWLCFLCREKP